MSKYIFEPDQPQVLYVASEIQNKKALSNVSVCSSETKASTWGNKTNCFALIVELLLI